VLIMPIEGRGRHLDPKLIPPKDWLAPFPYLMWARNELMLDPLRTQSSRTRPGWGSCYACLLTTVHSGRSK
jgi:hypothetical protein